MRTHTSATNRDRGFTLIELMVVAIIFAVLSAVSVPIYLRHRAKADVESVRKDAEQAALALTARLTGSGTLPATLNADNPNLWGYKASSPNNRLIEYMVAEDRFRLCILNVATNPDAWAVYASATEKVTSGTGTEPTGACDGDTTGPALAAEPTRGSSVPIPTPTPTAIPTVAPPPAPSVPSNVTVSSVNGESRATVSWSGVANASKYAVYLDGAATAAWSGAATSAPLTGLSNGPHTVRVSAFRSMSESAASPATNFTIVNNDLYADAAAVPVLSAADTYTTGDFSNATAAAQSGEPANSGRSLWWAFRVANSRAYTFTVLNPSDGSARIASPRVTVYRLGATTPNPMPASNPPAYDPVTVNLAGALGASGGSAMAVGLEHNDYIAVRVSTDDATAAGSGKFRLQINAAPYFDHSSAAIVLSAPAPGNSTTSAVYDNTFAGRERGEDGDGRATVWFKFTAQGSSDITIDRSAYSGTQPTEIALYNGTTGPPLQRTFGSSLTRRVNQGGTYWVRIAVASSAPDLNARGQFRIRLTQAPVLPPCFNTYWNGYYTVNWSAPPGVTVTNYEVSIRSPYGTEYRWIGGGEVYYQNGNLPYDEAVFVTAITPEGNIPSCQGWHGAG